MAKIKVIGTGKIPEKVLIDGVEMHDVAKVESITQPREPHKVIVTFYVDEFIIGGEKH